MPSYHSSCWYGGRCRLKQNDKNERIHEETSEGEKTDSVSTTVNDAEGTDLTLFVDMEEVVGKENYKNDRIDEEKSESETTDSMNTTVNNEELGGNVYSEDFYDIYGDLDEHIT